jgi:hypothetical protein
MSISLFSLKIPATDGDNCMAFLRKRNFSTKALPHPASARQFNEISLLETLSAN